MKFISFERLLGLSSLFIASCAAFFSIIGIGMLFSGSAIAAMVMASSLEIGKLVATSFLYRYWNKTKTFLKIYLTSSVVILMIITSLGIFGYLSGAYQQSSIENQLIEQKILLIEEQKNTIKDKIMMGKNRISSITQLRNSQEERLTQSITNTLISRNPIQLRQIQQQTQELIEQSEKDLNAESIKIQKATDEIQQLDKQITELKLESGAKKDVQTFKFIADEFGVNINKVVKWFIVALISVFDPLAICLLLAYNTAIISDKTPKNDILVPGSSKINLNKDDANIMTSENHVQPESIKISEESSTQPDSNINTSPESNNIIPIQNNQTKSYPFSF